MAVILTKPAAYVINSDPTTGDTIATAVVTKNQAAIDYIFANYVDATTTTKGAVALATNAEAVTGTDTAKATTCAGVTAAIAAAVASASGFGSSSTKTIASGSITVSGTKIQRYHLVDTEASAATDDLDNINGGNVGDEMILMCVSAARVPRLVPSATLRLEANFELDSVYDSIRLFCVASGTWVETSRSNVA